MSQGYQRMSLAEREELSIRHAQGLAVDRRLRHTVFRLLRRQWSPQQISGYLRERRSPGDLPVSAETIYSYLYVLPRGELRRELLSHLRQHRKNRGHAAAGRTGAARSPR